MGGRSSKEPDPPLRIVLIGKTGVGKSAAANTILGRKAFESSSSAKSKTAECTTASVTSPREIIVVDTPGILDPDTEKTEEIKREILRCIKVSAPGPHAFLLVMSVGRFTREDHNAVKALQEIFGERAADYMIVLFTRGDELEGQTIIEFVRNANKDLRKAIRSCGGRFHGFNNKITSSVQVDELVRKIDEMVATNGGEHFSEEMYEETTRVMLERGLAWDSDHFDEELSFLPRLAERVVLFQTALMAES